MNGYICCRQLGRYDFVGKWVAKITIKRQITRLYCTRAICTHTPKPRVDRPPLPKPTSIALNKETCSLNLSTSTQPARAIGSPNTSKPRLSIRH